MRLAVLGQYAMYIWVGSQALTVIDAEAREIIMDFIQNYYYSDLSNEMFFSRAFEGAGQHIMSVTR